MAAEPADDVARPPRRRRLRWRWALAVLLTLAALEAGLRLLERHQGRTPPGPGELGAANSQYVPHPYIGWQLRPDDPRTGSNGLGMRAGRVALRKPAGTYRILCLGGSTTFGSGLPTQEAYPARLEAMLQEHASEGRAYEVLNCGVPGYTTAENLVNLALRLVEFDPDALIVYHAVNDARLIQTKVFLPDYSHMRRAWNSGCVSGLETLLLGTSASYRALARGLGLRAPPTRLEHLTFVEGYRELYAPPEEAPQLMAGVSAFRRNLRHLVVLARADGIEPALATFAFCGRKLVPGKQQDFGPTIRLMNTAIVDLGAELAVPVFRVAEAMEGDPAWFQDFVHMDAPGAERMARAIFEHARAEGLWGLPAGER